MSAEIAARFIRRCIGFHAAAQSNPAGSKEETRRLWRGILTLLIWLSLRGPVKGEGQ
jgi:hypothetical protein